MKDDDALFTDPASEGNELEEAFNGEEECEAGVHVTENVAEHKRRPMMLRVGKRRGSTLTTLYKCLVD